MYAHLSECLIDDGGTPELIVGKEIDLVKEISNVNTTEWIHL